MLTRDDLFLKLKRHWTTVGASSGSGMMDIVLAASGARSSRRPFNSGVRLPLTRDDKIVMNALKEAVYSCIVSSHCTRVLYRL